MIVDRYVQLTHMKAWQVMQEKTELLLETVGEKKKEEGDGYFYDVPEYLIHVCQRMRSLVGGITETDVKYISLDIIYRIEPRTAGKWRHIQANEKRMGIVYDEEKHLENQNPIVMDVLCILRSLADSDAFQSGRCAEHNGRPETLAIIN